MIDIEYIYETKEIVFVGVVLFITILILIFKGNL